MKRRTEGEISNAAGSGAVECNFAPAYERNPSQGVLQFVSDENAVTAPRPLPLRSQCIDRLRELVSLGADYLLPQLGREKDDVRGAPHEGTRRQQLVIVRLIDVI